MYNLVLGFKFVEEDGVGELVKLEIGLDGLLSEVLFSNPFPLQSPSSNK